MSFNGTSSYVNLPAVNVSDTDEITVTARIMWDGSKQGNDQGTIIAKEQSYYIQLTSAGKIAVYTYPDVGDSVYDNSISSIPINEWVDIAFTEKNGLRKIYINGKLDYSIQREPSIRYYNRITSIGGQSLSNYRYFNGKIDELSLWDRAIEDSEIISLNNNIIPTNTTGLKGYYSFDNKKLYLKDKSSSNNNGTVVNTTNLNNSTSFDIKAMYFEFSSNSINSVPIYFGENKYIELTDKLTIKNNDYTETTNSNISLNTTNKVVMRWNGSKYEIFINGVKDNSVSVGAPTLLNINEVTLGNNLYNGKYFNGDIYDVRLSSSEISEYDALASTDTLNIKYTLDYNNTEVIYKPIDYDTYLFDSVKKENHNYAYDLDWKDQLKEYDGFLYTYDEIGNPLTITKDSVLYRSFVWEKGRVLSSQYIRRSQDGLNDIDVFYKYNDSGIRVEKKVVDKVTLNEEVTTYKLSGSSIVEEIKGTDIIHYTYDLEGSLIAITYNNEIYYYIKNITGDIIGLLDEEGNKVVSYEYDSWGRILSINDTSNIDLGNKNPFRYKGYYYDNESEYYYLNSRYYDSEVKRFINADGYVSTGSGIIGHNMYSYVGNNPVIRADYSGNFWDIVIDVFGIGYSYYEYVKNPSLKTLAVLGGDIGLSFIPFVPNIGSAKITSKIILKSDKITDISKNVDNINDTVRTSDNIVDSTKYTSSTLKLGQEMHKFYKLEDANGITKIKEFRLPSGKRIDYIDFNTKTIYELKPYNPRSIKSGYKQLNQYVEEVENIYGKGWKVKLETY